MEIKYTIQKIKYTIPRNSNCEMIMAMNQNNKEDDISKRKLVITVGGNAMFPENSICNLISIKKDISNDLLAIGLPKKATSSAELVDATVSAMLRAKQAGYKIENITVAGHSLGGAITALALQKVKQYLEPNEKFAGYVNHRSFNNIGGFIAGYLNRDKTFSEDLKNSNDLYKLNKASWFGWLVNGLTWLLGVQLNAEAALKDLPVKQMKIYADGDDKVIRNVAAFANAAKENSINIPTKIKITPEHGHTDSRSNSLYKPSKPYTEWNTEEDLKDETLYMDRKYVDSIILERQNDGIDNQI